MTELEEAYQQVRSARALCDDIDKARIEATVHSAVAWKEFDRVYWVWDKLRRAQKNGA